MHVDHICRLLLSSRQVVRPKADVHLHMAHSNRDQAFFVFNFLLTVRTDLVGTKPAAEMREGILPRDIKNDAAPKKKAGKASRLLTVHGLDDVQGGQVGLCPIPSERGRPTFPSSDLENRLAGTTGPVGPNFAPRSKHLRSCSCV